MLLKTIQSLSILLISLMIWSSCNGQPDQPGEVKTGAEVLIEHHLVELDGLRVGLVMNPTARIGDTHMLDTLRALNVNVTALFAPEHGFRGEAGAGDKIEDGVDVESGLPVFSLYGSTRKPTSDMLIHVDILIFDMQDVGLRFYTYIATLGLVLEAAAEEGVPVWVLDRPNPLGGNYLSGWMLEEEFESFVGPYPIPAAHGLTMGEMAQMIAGEKWMEFQQDVNLRVIPMQGWEREMKWPDTNLKWVPPSPNLPTFEHAFIYAGTVLFEGTNLSEGRGTDNPFLTLGSPGTVLDETVTLELNKLDGIRFEAIDFTPRSIPGVAPNPKLLDESSRGVRLYVESYTIDPLRTGMKVFQLLMQATESAETVPFIYLLSGTEQIDAVIEGTIDPLTVDFGLESFIEKREPYLVY